MTRKFKLKLRDPETGREWWEEFSPSASTMRKLNRLTRDGTILVAVSSKNSKIKAAIQGFIDQHKAQGYVDPMSGVSAGARILGQTTKETAGRVRDKLGEGLKSRIPGLRRKKEEVKGGDSPC